MAGQNTAHKNRISELMDELQKNKPDQKKIKFLFKEFDFSYTPDPVDQMMTVLEKCEGQHFKSHNTAKDDQELEQA